MCSKRYPIRSLQKCIEECTLRFSKNLSMDAEAEVDIDVEKPEVFSKTPTEDL